MRVYQGGDVRIADLIAFDDDGAPWLRDVELNGCHLIGPAVLLIAGDKVAFRNNRDMDTRQLWAIDSGRGYIGGVGLERCTIQDCTFTNIGIAGPHDLIDQFLT